MATIISTKTTSGGGLAVTGDASGILQLASADGTTAVTIDASQNVGIGVTPIDKLDINTTAGRVLIRTGANTGGTSSGNGIESVNTIATAEADLNIRGSIITAITGATERMRIDGSGNVLVGTTNSDPVTNGVNGVVINQSGFVLRTPTNTNKWGLDATSGNHIRFFTSGATAAGIISSNGATTTYGTGSDYRMKKNIAPMTGALDTVAKLKPVTYTWKPEFAGTKSSGQGFIAHELQAVVPDCVTGEKDAVDAEGNPQYQGIDTSFLVATLTSAIQELKAIIDTQQTRITALEAK